MIHGLNIRYLFKKLINRLPQKCLFNCLDKHVLKIEPQNLKDIIDAW